MFLEFIGVLDSGIGGLNVLKKLEKVMPNENFIYFGDNANAPYGNKSKRELLSLTISNINFLLMYPLKAIVLACNTLSACLLNEIKDYVSLPVYPVFPPVEVCKIKKEKTLLLATCATASNYKSDELCDVVGLKSLAEEIEQKSLDLNLVDFATNIRYKSQGVFADKKGYYHNVILGCTHYDLIKNKIIDHFCPQKIIDGADFAVKNVLKNIQNQKTLVKCLQNRILFIGKNARKNYDVYNIYKNYDQ